MSNSGSAPIPKGLQQAILSGDCVLFLGAGIGGEVKSPSGASAPTGSELAEELATAFGIDADGEYDLAKVSEVIELKKGRIELYTFLKERLSNLEPSENLKWLLSFRWRAIYTTNYDGVIDRTYNLLPNPIQKPVVISTTSRLKNYDPLFEVPVFHLHGALFSQELPKLVITEGDYITFREGRRMLFELLKQSFATSPLLYIGYSNHDFNWKQLLAEISAEFSPSPMPMAYRVSPSTTRMDRDILRSKNIETIDTDLVGFVASARILLSPLSIPKDRLSSLAGSIPGDFHRAYESNPAPVVRFFNSWKYINQVSLSESPNVHNFLRGDRPNWSLIERKEYFKRDLEEEIYNDLLDYATSSTRNPKVLAVFAPAGYGTTTLLMTLAFRLVADNAGSVYFLKPDQEILEGDVLFGASVFQGRNFFFIDNAADYHRQIIDVVAAMRTTGKSGLFILGERLNEWRQTMTSLRLKEFRLESLSDPEIHNLLDCLKNHGELNALEPLERPIQFAIIKEKDNKELLVAMREATEGRSFDAIIEDEFRGIQSESAKSLYLTVCCFFRWCPNLTLFPVLFTIPPIS